MMQRWNRITGEHSGAADGQSNILKIHNMALQNGACVLSAPHSGATLQQCVSHTRQASLDAFFMTGRFDSRNVKKERRLRRPMAQGRQTAHIQRLVEECDCTTSENSKGGTVPLHRAAFMCLRHLWFYFFLCVFQFVLLLLFSVNISPPSLSLHHSVFILTSRPHLIISLSVPLGLAHALYLCLSFPLALPRPYHSALVSAI